MSSTSAALDPTLFAESPARDARFTVAARWVECANFPDGNPLRAIEFLHRQMNEEIDSLECSAANLRDFPEAPWELRLSLASQCADEGRHAAMFRRIFEKRGGHVGQYPVLNFQYRIVAHIPSLVGRLAIRAPGAFHRGRGHPGGPLGAGGAQPINHDRRSPR